MVKMARNVKCTLFCCITKISCSEGNLLVAEKECIFIQQIGGLFLVFFLFSLVTVTGAKKIKKYWALKALLVSPKGRQQTYFWLQPNNAAKLWIVNYILAESVCTWVWINLGRFAFCHQINRCNLIIVNKIKNKIFQNYPSWFNFFDSILDSIIAHFQSKRCELI